MYTPDDIADAIEAFPSQAADALDAIQLLPDSAADGNRAGATALRAEGLNTAADGYGEPRGQFWVGRLEAKGLLETFAHALAARGVAVDLSVADAEDGHVDPRVAARFPRQALSFRCRIIRAGVSSGSGVLIGPSTVLTAWHVVAPPAAYDPDAAIADIQVLLADEKRYDASVIESSPCSEDEFSARVPANDLDVADLHDMAFLKLEAPAGATLGYAALTTELRPFRTSTPIFLVHFPDGADPGLGEGVTSKIRSISARVGHSVPSAGGSSGGGCFDTRRELIGVHQGKQTNGKGRYVPIERFMERARTVVANDIAPAALWSLNDAPDGRLVFGRRTLFRAFSAASEGGRVRGIHIRRANPEDEPAELLFSFDILKTLIARNPDARLCRIALGTLIDDIPGEVVRRVRDSGLLVDELEERPGVASGETAPEAVGADRGRRAADLVNDAAAAAEVTVWLFFDQPAVSFGDEQRSAFEGVIARSLRHEHVRIVVAGLEPAAVPGQVYYPNERPDGEPGLMVDFIRGFDRNDVAQAIALAADAAGSDLGIDGATLLAQQALAGLPATNGIHAPSLSAEVAQRLAEPIQSLFEGNRNA